MVYFFYFILIFFLVYWIERPVAFIPKVLIMRKDPALDLENWLKNFQGLQRQDLNTPPVLAVYKFYTGVIEVLLSLARRMGGSYKDSLLCLREGLQFDRQFEKKIKEVKWGMYGQMIFMMLLTWGFILGALQIIEIKIEAWKLVLIFIWQLIGLISLPVIIKYFREKYFSQIGLIWKMLYILNSLVRVPISRSEIFNYAGIKELDHIKGKSLTSIVLKLKETCQNALKTGASYEEDVRFLMGEVRFQEKWHFELFEKRLMVVKLVLLAVFFLPSYLAFIFMVLRSLLVLM